MWQEANKFALSTRSQRVHGNRGPKCSFRRTVCNRDQFVRYQPQIMGRQPGLESESKVLGGGSSGRKTDRVKIREVKDAEGETKGELWVLLTGISDDDKLACTICSKFNTIL